MGRAIPIVMAIAMFASLVTTTADSHAASFYTISGVTSDTSSTDFFPASRLIEGAGVGFDASAPHNLTSGLTWVTNAPNGGTGDYFSPTPTPSPRLVFDLGANKALSEISIWGYADTNGNGASQVSLRFATEADGTGGFGTTVTYNPTFNPTLPVTPRQSFGFNAPLVARYVELTPEDNFFESSPGGDRVGLGEIAFADERYVVTPVSATSNNAGGGDLNPVGQIIDGSGLSDPDPDISNILSVTHATTSASNRWVTDAPNGSGDFYANSTPDPVLEFDLGGVHRLVEMVTWNYSVVGNAAKTFDADFIIDGVVVDTLTGLTFSSSTNPAGLISFGGLYSADTVRLTITDNYLEAGPGGDRVGLAEVRFIAIPEPGTLFLLAVAAPLALRRNRRATRG